MSNIIEEITLYDLVGYAYVLHENISISSLEQYEADIGYLLSPQKTY